MATETSAAPNNTTLPAETSSVIPDIPAKTTAAPDNTTLSAEVSSVIPDTTAEKTSPPPQTSAPSASGNAAIAPATTVGTPEKKESNVPATPIQKLWALAQTKGHPEIWGVTLADPETHVPSQIIFQKYLNANDGDLSKAEDQLTKTLEWRAKTKPLDLIKKTYAKSKFENLGYVTTYADGNDSAIATAPELKEVFTWNIYGGVKNIEETFGNQAEFLEWRTALMEMALQSLDLASATKPITADYDPYKIFQVHDYKSISFFSSPPQVKSASAETIKVFAQNYPELLKEKFFVNVPAVMGFVYAFMKLFVAAKTIKKFHPMSKGGALAQEFGDSKVRGLGSMLPKEYGGLGKDLKIAGTEPTLE